MWEIIKNKVERFGWEDGFSFLFWCACAALIIYMGMIATADRTIQGYYLSSYSTEAGVAYKIKASVDFMDDPTAFSSHDYKETMAVFNQLPKSGMQCSE